METNKDQVIVMMKVRKFGLITSADSNKSNSI
jgi:hypothetical protein